MSTIPRYQFTTSYQQILARLRSFDARDYAATRNYIDGGVSQLSPYISRGVISTRQVMHKLLHTNPARHASINKFIQELAWRDYWQQVWISKGDDINTDLRYPQTGVTNHAMSVAIMQANCAIVALDDAIDELYRSGYMHNHVRMTIASLACNIARSHWRVPARWMYYHLLDGDWASNALSWQWVAGSNAHKKYFANQDNINQFCHTQQHNTCVDMTYDQLTHLPVPSSLQATSSPELTTHLPQQQTLIIDKSKPTLIYNYYNLDPQWRAAENVNRLLLLEPSLFAQYPVAERNIQFAIQLAQNIPGIQIFSGEFAALEVLLDGAPIIFKEHPLNRHYLGQCDPREWMFNVSGYYPSFSAFWKQCQKEIKSMQSGQLSLFT